MNLMTEPVGLRLRGSAVPGEYDDYGSQVYGPGRTVVVYGWYEPRGSGDGGSGENQNQQIDGYWVYLPLDAPLTSADAVVLFGTVQDEQLEGGDDYQVIGEPGRQPGGFIVSGFIKAAVERVRG